MVIKIRKLIMKNKYLLLSLSGMFMLLFSRCSIEGKSSDNVVIAIDSENCLMFSYLENAQKVRIDTSNNEIRITLDEGNDNSYITLYFGQDSSLVEDDNLWHRLSDMNLNYVFNYKLDGTEIQKRDVIRKENLYVDYIIYKNSQANLILYINSHICSMSLNNFLNVEDIEELIRTIHISTCNL